MSRTYLLQRYCKSRRGISMRAIESQPDATHVTSSTIAADIDDGQPRFTRRETLLTMLGVLMVMLLASLDQTIVGTAHPKIIAELNGFNEYTWVTTAYLL